MKFKVFALATVLFVGSAAADDATLFKQAKDAASQLLDGAKAALLEAPAYLKDTALFPLQSWNNAGRSLVVVAALVAGCKLVHAVKANKGFCCGK